MSSRGVVAAFASLGAGAVHAAAVGVHDEHRQALLAFTLVAAFQLGWGALFLARPGRALAAVGAVGNAAALGGWAMAKTSGIGFVDGLEAAEDVQRADALAAGLAIVAVLASLAALRERTAAPAIRPARPLVGGAALAAAVMAVPGMASAGDHAHTGGSDHAHADITSVAAGDDHAGEHATDDHGAVAAVAGAADDHGAATPTPYDPTKPIDLGGVEGVSLEQQARAENLIAVTLARLPRFADPAVAEAAGYHSIGDAITGHEHFINWSTINDGRILDPDAPESLVYAERNGQRTLQAAMFMLPSGSTLDDVPDVGGPLTQWHIHDDLCFTDDPTAAKVAGITTVGGTCAPPLRKFEPVPMIHVWITPHRCGPFASLDGIAGGQIAAGEERLCDAAHGSH